MILCVSKVGGKARRKSLPHSHPNSVSSNVPRWRQRTFNMKYVAAFALMIAMFGFTNFVSARSYGGKGGQNGVVGVIADVGSRGFTMTTKDGKTWKVACDSNTKFLQGADTATPSDVVKSGATVNVFGATDGTGMIQAMSVTATKETAPKKKN